MSSSPLPRSMIRLPAQGEHCPYSHDLSLEPCKHMVLSGTCTYRGCQYSHAPLEPEHLQALKAQWDSQTPALPAAVPPAAPPMETSSIYASSNPLLAETQLPASAGPDCSGTFLAPQAVVPSPRPQEHLDPSTEDITDPIVFSPANSLLPPSTLTTLLSQRPNSFSMGKRQKVLLSENPGQVRYALKDSQGEWPKDLS